MRQVMQNLFFASQLQLSLMNGSVFLRDLFQTQTTGAHHAVMSPETMASQATSRHSLMPLIGCAGWSLSSAQKMHFPPDGSHLQRYAAILPAVEINSSFYRPHRPETYQRWRESVPESFRFSVKVPRVITHEKRLVETNALVSAFLLEAGSLGEKLGCLLVQLPPSLGFNRRTVQAFFHNLTAQTAASVVCEARHPSWFSTEAMEALLSMGIGQVIADPPVAAAVVTTNTAYVRLHGSPEMYHSAYSEEFLTRLADKLKQYQEEGRTVWCIFDNTASGAAMPNALSLLARFNAVQACGLEANA